MVSASDLQRTLDREQYLHLVGTANLVSDIERGGIDQAIKSGRIYLDAYGLADADRHRDGNVLGTDAEHEKVMALLEELSVSLAK